MRRLLMLALGCVLGGCADGADGPRDASFEVRDSGLDGQIDPFIDTDQDGLCDVTEEQAGSNVDDPDTDADGLPDMVELIYGFGATDPLSPEDDQVVSLEARPGAEARLGVRFTVDGKGGDYTGYFEDSTSSYSDGSTAGLYLKSSQAIRSEPPEAARVVDGPRQRFRAVLGSARLELEVLFQAGDAVDPEGCVRAYPFRYGMREDGAGRIDDRLYLLVLAPGQAAPEDYCQPVACL